MNVAKFLAVLSYYIAIGMLGAAFAYVFCKLIGVL